MKNIILVSVLFLAQHTMASPVQYFNQAELPSNTRQIKLVDAEYVMMPTKTMTRAIPNCNPNGEASRDCNEVIVLEQQPAIRANISYRNSMFNDESNRASYTSVILALNDFSNTEVNSLAAAYPGWKHPFSTAPRDFAKNHLNLHIAKVNKTIQIVDVRKSHLCPMIGETNEPARNCVEQLVYKNALSPVLVLTVTRK